MPNAVLNAYCIAAALFFAACAFAQLNDPDPILWIIGYLVGGSFFNVLVMMYFETETAQKKILPMVNVFAVGNAAITAYMIISLVPKIDFHQPVRDVAWSVLEFEEGREIAGLLILLLHVLRLSGYLREGSSSTVEEGQSTVSNSKRSSSGLVGTLVLASVLGGAVYLWVYYQPEMNARYKTEHCSGQFVSPDGAQEDL